MLPLSQSGCELDRGTKSMTEIVVSAQTLFAVVLGVIVFVALAIWAVVRHYRTKLQQACPFNPDTGMANPETLDCLLGFEWSRLQRGGKEFAIVAINLDGITQINSTMGRSAGDQLITQVAQRLQQTAREVDTLAHIEGDEFMAFLPQTTLENATVAAERLRKALLETPFKHAGKDLTVRASFGVALAKHTDLDLGDVSKRAKAAMRHAKRLGRDMVCVEASV